MATDKPQIKANVEPHIKAKLTYIADLDKRSLSNLIEVIASRHIEEYERVNGELIIDKNGKISKKNIKLGEVKQSNSRTG